MGGAMRRTVPLAGNVPAAVRCRARLGFAARLKSRFH